jgi:hypothetical protein
VTRSCKCTFVCKKLFIRHRASACAVSLMIALVSLVSLLVLMASNWFGPAALSLDDHGHHRPPYPWENYSTMDMDSFYRYGGMDPVPYLDYIFVKYYSRIAPTEGKRGTQERKQHSLAMIHGYASQYPNYKQLKAYCAPRNTNGKPTACRRCTTLRKSSTRSARSR